MSSSSVYIVCLPICLCVCLSSFFSLSSFFYLFSYLGQTRTYSNILNSIKLLVDQAVKMELETLIECPVQFQMVRGDFLGTCRTYSIAHRHEIIFAEFAFYFYFHFCWQNFVPFLIYFYFCQLFMQFNINLFFKLFSRC